MNEDIRAAVVASGVRSYQVADAVGVSENTWYRMLRRPLDDEQREKILTAIRDLKKRTV